MKCVCGYEQKDDFDHPVTKIPVGPKLVKVLEHNDFYVCPVCGTIRCKNKGGKNGTTD